MLGNYLKIALRNLLKYKTYSVVSILGLAIGLACSFTILLYVQHEFSFDRFHEKSERIYRIYTDFYYRNDLPLRYVATFPAAGPELAAAFFEIEQFVRFKRANVSVASEEEWFDENRFFFADSTIWDVFTFPLVRGNVETALRDPFTVVLTEEAGEKYFGNRDPLGQRLTVDDTVALTVTGVLGNVPENSHIRFDFLASFATFELLNPDYSQWSWDDFYTYLLLGKGVDIEDLEPRFASVVDPHFPSVLRKVLKLQPLTDIHLRSHAKNELEANGSESNVYIFSTTALFILLIACINFVNLATARAASRAREVGMRKVVGARRLQLVLQFLGEAVLVSLLAWLIAGVLMEILAPFSMALTGLELTMLPGSSWLLTLGFAGIAVLAGIIAGVYPALFLSAFKPVKTLTAKGSAASKGARLRKGLVVFQFGISVVLLVATSVVSRQLTYMRNQNLGFEKEQLVIVPFGNSEAVQRQRDALKDEILRDARVLSASVTSAVPGQRIGVLSTVVGPDDKRNVPILFVDHDFVDTYQTSFLAGRNFSRSIVTDASESILVNEALVREAGWGSAEEALGRELTVAGHTGKVVGVIRDFHFQSLQHTISPTVFTMQRNWHRYLAIRVTGQNMASTLASLEKAWQKLEPTRPFDFFFLDEYYDRQYRAEEKLRVIGDGFAVLAVLVACLGLFGLATFTARQRTKEIGIRKVLGATVPGILHLLSRAFIKPVLMANLVAWPISWVLMNRWLQNFAYRIEIGWWGFVLAGWLALVIAFLTVSTQAIRAALANPVESLRYE